MNNSNITTQYHYDIVHDGSWGYVIFDQENQQVAHDNDYLDWDDAWHGALQEIEDLYEEELFSIISRSYQAVRVA